MTSRKNFSFIYFLGIFLFSSCNDREPSNSRTNKNGANLKAVDTIIKKGNITTIISCDTSKLDGILTFKYYAPISINYHYTHIDNSGSKDRISVPGPSDYNLEAVMYFDSSTFRQIIDFYHRADWVSPKCSKQEFNFAWLDSATRKELLLSDTIPEGYIDLFWTDPNAANCHLWMLDKKILVHRSTY